MKRERETTCLQKKKKTVDGITVSFIFKHRVLKILSVCAFFKPHIFTTAYSVIVSRTTLVQKTLCITTHSGLSVREVQPPTDIYTSPLSIHAFEMQFEKPLTGAFYFTDPLNI